MGIEHSQTCVTGTAWQITGCGVRRVAIRRPVSETVSAVSRHIMTAEGAGYCARAVHARNSDLFLDREEARREFLRRMSLSRCTNDRRVRRWTTDSDLRPAEGVLVSVTLALFCLALVL